MDYCHFGCIKKTDIKNIHVHEPFYFIFWFCDVARLAIINNKI